MAKPQEAVTDTQNRTPTDSETPVLGEVFKQMWAVFGHKRSLLLITLIALLFGIRSSHGIFEINVHEIASSIFQVAGTMVALVLPAAELSNNFVSKLSDEYVKLVDIQPVSAEQKREGITKIAKRTKSHLVPAWRASIYVICSFLLSIIGMNLKAIYTPSVLIDARIFSASIDFSLDLFIFGASIGFLVVGSLWFFPTIWYAFSLTGIDAVFDMIDILYPIRPPDTGTVGQMKSKQDASTSSDTQVGSLSNNSKEIATPTTPIIETPPQAQPDKLGD